MPLPFVLSSCPFDPSDTLNLAISTELSAIAAAPTASSAIRAEVIASSAIRAEVIASSAILAVVTASSARSAVTIVPSTIFADVTVSSPGTTEAPPFTSNCVGRYGKTNTRGRTHNNKLLKSQKLMHLPQKAPKSVLIIKNWF